MKDLFGDFNAEVGREGMFKPTAGNNRQGQKFAMVMAPKQ
jgi:hypothetical protein